jgi:hypothetical protein
LWPTARDRSMPLGCLSVSRAKTWRSVPGCAGIQFADWERSSDSIPAATYLHLCRAVDVLENEGARFSGDGVRALSGDSPDYLMEAVPPSINSNGLHLAARARHAGVSHARHEQEPQSARVLRWFAARLPSDKHFRSFSAR